MKVTGRSFNLLFSQIELVLKFLQKAALSLREPYFLKAPSVKLSGKVNYHEMYWEEPKQGYIQRRK